MKPKAPFVLKRILIVTALLGFMLLVSIFLGLSMGSTESDIRTLFNFWFRTSENDSMLWTIIWQIRLPRVLLATLVGAALSLGGLVFQALLRNPLAEPYILGISGGAAVGAIAGILMGLSRFPGVGLMAFIGSTATLVLVLIIASGESILRRDSLLLGGVMVNAFCSAVIMFLISLTQDARLHNILFWLMGDLSATDIRQVGLLALVLLPSFVLLFLLSRSMNLLLMGREMAMSMGVNVRLVMVTLLLTTSFMVSLTVSYSGLLGFVGLVMPHLLRLLLGPDHRVLVPACVLGGGAYMVLCDVLARVLPDQGEMPVGVITAMIGAPLFIFLLKSSRR